MCTLVYYTLHYWDSLSPSSLFHVREYYTGKNEEYILMWPPCIHGLWPHAPLHALCIALLSCSCCLVDLRFFIYYYSLMHVWLSEKMSRRAWEQYFCPCTIVNGTNVHLYGLTLLACIDNCALVWVDLPAVTYFYPWWNSIIITLTCTWLCLTI